MDYRPARATYLAVTDIEAAHRELSQRGVRVSDIRHKSPADGWTGGRQPGTDPQRRNYASLAGFTGPDGNAWLLQEIGYRLEPGAPSGGCALTAGPADRPTPDLRAGTVR